jgi:hypothetical protein
MLKRYDMKAIMADPAKRRMLVARGTQAAQAREGIDITLEEALVSYDALEADGSLARVRRDADNWGQAK